MSVRLLFIFFAFYVFQSTCANGQAPIIEDGPYCKTGGGDFDVTPYEGCGSLKVTLTNKLIGAQNVGYITNYDINTQPNKSSPVTTATYNTLGTYTIIQVGSLNSTGFTLCKQVTVHDDSKVNAKFEVFCEKIAKITITDDAISRGYDHIEINWGDGQPVSIWKQGDGIVTHGYTGSIPKISIQGKYAPTVRCSGQVTILDPVFSDNSVETIQVRRVEMKADGKVSLLYQGMENVLTELFYSDGAGNFKTTGIEKALDGANNLEYDNNFNPDKEYRFKMISSDNCGGKKESREVGTMTLNATPADGEISLEWNAYSDKIQFTGYQLLRDSVVIQSFQSIDDLKYVDKDLDCNKTYEYQIVALTDLVRSFSAPKSEKTTTSAPDKITGASVSVKDNNVIEADVVLGTKGLTTTYNTIVERAEQGSSAFKQVSGIVNQDIHFEDNTVNTATTSYCYRFSYQNSCPLQSEFTEPVCTILLRQTPTELTWNNAVSFIEGLDSYDVVQDQSNTLTPVGFNTTFALDPANLSKGDYSYKIRAKSRNGSFLSFSNIVKYQQNASLLIPDAFTPNGDNINEKFEIKGLFINSFRISIFNRWGQVVFHSEDITESWDGTIEGAQAPSGYYTYRAETSDVSDQLISKEGTFLLIR